MDTRSIQENQYQENDSDRTLILSLLSEYTNRLNEASDLIFKQNRTLDLILFLPMIGFAVVVVLFLDSKAYSLIPYLTVFFLACVVSFLSLVIERVNRINSLKKSRGQLVRKLERIVSAASQSEEYRMQSNSFAKRIEMDLRIADAEAAIDYYKNTARSNDFTAYFSRKLRQ